MSTSLNRMNVISSALGARRCKITRSGFVHVMSSRSQMNLSRNVSLKGREVGVCVGAGLAFPPNVVEWTRTTGWSWSRVFPLPVVPCLNAI